RSSTTAEPRDHGPAGLLGSSVGGSPRDEPACAVQTRSGLRPVASGTSAVHPPFERVSEPPDHIGSQDLASSPLGSRDRWPEVLRVIVDMMLGSNQPMFVVWGRERVVVHNDAFARLAGHRGG